MTEAIHTSGPWSVEEYGDDDVPASVIHKDSQTHLIAAAPDMLAALKALVTFTEQLLNEVGVSKHYPSAARARAAIAKAEGRAP